MPFPDMPFPDVPFPDVPFPDVAVMMSTYVDKRTLST
jgi:hypothetical protein